MMSPRARRPGPDGAEENVDAQWTEPAQGRRAERCGASRRTYTPPRSQQSMPQRRMGQAETGTERSTATRDHYMPRPHPPEEHAEIAHTALRED